MGLSILRPAAWGWILKKYPEQARALTSGPLWLLPPGPDQVQNMMPPEPIRDTLNDNVGKYSLEDLQDLKN